MNAEEFKFLDKSIILEKKEELDSSYKISSYKSKLKLMEQKQIPQKPIYDVLNHFFLKNNLISKKLKNSVIKIIYCEKDRIILLFTKLDKEIVWNRDKLIQNYGWFFFVSKPEDKEKKTKESREEKESKREKESKKEEITVSSEDYKYDDGSITLKEKKNMRPLYHTKEYFQYVKLMNSESIPQMPIKAVLDDFFQKNENIPLKEKKAIKKIIYYREERVVVVKSLIGDKMYEYLQNLVRKYGWYFYITGVPVGDSEISIAIDKIEKSYSEVYFKNISLIETLNESQKIRVLIYPIVSKPNHNCIILGLGNINILLDCGLAENHIEHIKQYLQNLDNFVAEKEAQQKVGEIQKETQTSEDKIKINNIKDINSLLSFEDDSEEDDEKKGNQASVEKTNKSAVNNVLPTSPSSPSQLNINSSKYKIDAIYISHSHFDHVSGLKDLIKTYPDVPILCSRITLDLYLLRDSNFLKQQNLTDIEEVEYRNIVKNVIYVENGSKIEFKNKNCFLSFFHAGHMPGSLMFLAKVNDFRFLYTGDYTLYDVVPFAGTKRFLDQISRPIDFLLIDGTSASEDLGDPGHQIHSLILFMEQKAEYGDNSLIGADPSSLAITFMLTFWRYFRKLQLKMNYKKRPNIYVDMMVRKNIQVINHRYEYIYGPISRLIRDKANPFNSIKIRWFDHSDLDFLHTKNNIIISHPPDLSYGIIRPIVNVIARNKHNFVFLSGSIHEKPGTDLIEGKQEIEFSETWKVPFRALLLNTFAPNIKIKLHADKSQMMEMIKALEPKEVCFFHQSPKKLMGVAEEVKLSGVPKVSVPLKRRLMLLN